MHEKNSKVILRLCLMSKKDYDKTLTRLVGILTKLSNGEMPTSKELAEEFGVGVRTIQKDINERLSYFPIVKTSDHRYTFAYGYSLKQTDLTDEEMIFLHLALSQFEDVDDIDKIKDKIFKKIIHKKLYNPYYIKQEDLEDIDVDSPFISQLESLIENKEIAKIDFTHETKELELYKIAAFEGLWYLFAKDLQDGKIKTFRLTDIKKVQPLRKYHNTSDDFIERVLENVHSAFFEDGNTFEVVVKVYPEIAHYFLHRDFLESQQIEEKLDDGTLIVSFTVSHDEDIDNIIKSWLPHIEILEPKRFREKLHKELKEYLKKVEAN